MAESAQESTTIPVRVPEPADHAPPTLAQPASGPVAEMSGALSKDTTADSQASAGANLLAATNGTTTETSQVESEKPVATSTQETSETHTQTQDTEMKDTEDTEDAPAESQPDAETNGAAASKKTPNGKRKSTGGVPEHKNKKLNKKKSMSKITHLDAQPGEYYFARLKSYPPWPSMICDEEMLPTSLLNTRPVTTKKADGNYNEAYTDGGKKVMERTFPIMFLHTNEFAWIPNTDLAPLNVEDCKNVTEKGKGKALLQAYHVAAEGHDLQYFKDMLLDHAKALQEDEDAKEAKAAEKAAKADKKKRKSEVKAVDADAEMEDADATPAAKKSSKKRKKDAESDDEETEKPAKTPKTTKLKLTTNKTPATTEKKAKEPKSSSKPKSEKKKKPAAASDEDMADTVEKVEEKPLDPAEEREARKKEVLFLRHKLQKGFLSRDQTPREDEMPLMNNYIKKLEGYPELEVAIIRETKINKVLKALVKLSSIPRDEEFHFRKRSVDLLSKWNKILGAEPTDNGEQDEKAPATNGVHDEKKDDAEDSKDTAVTDKASDDVAKLSVVEALEKNDEDDKADGSPPGTASDLPKSKEGEAKALASVTEAPKEDGAVVKAPESAAGAAEAQEVVQATQ